MILTPKLVLAGRSNVAQSKSMIWQTKPTKTPQSKALTMYKKIIIYKKEKNKALWSSGFLILTPKLVLVGRSNVAK